MICCCMIVWYKSNARWLHKDFVLDFIESGVNEDRMCLDDSEPENKEY